MSPRARPPKCVRRCDWPPARLSRGRRSPAVALTYPRVPYLSRPSVANLVVRKRPSTFFPFFFSSDYIFLFILYLLLLLFYEWRRRDKSSWGSSMGPTRARTIVEVDATTRSRKSTDHYSRRGALGKTMSSMELACSNDFYYFYWCRCCLFLIDDWMWSLFV